ncbi:lamin tail domain-containing protein [bacterium]|nr:lamin tail domain-containing protein [candidate division CSSED10-310 bacterium]
MRPITGKWMVCLALFICMILTGSNGIRAVDNEMTGELKARDEGCYSTVLQNAMNEEIRLRVSVTDLFVDIRDVDGQEYSVVEIPGMPSTMADGYPMLPRIPQMIQISDTLAPDVSFVPLSVRRIPLTHPLLPAQDDLESEDIRIIEQDNVLRDASTDVYPSNRLLVSEPMIFRDVRIIMVSFHPVQYLVDEDCLEIIDEVEITVRYSSDDSPNRLLHHGPYSRSFEQLYRALIPNYDDAWIGDRDRTTAEIYLMIMPQAFESRCQGFITWKEQQGFRVDILRLESIGSNPTATQVKAVLTNLYNSENRPVYVCIAGNTNNFPVYESLDYYHPPADPFDDDYFYQLLEGTDLLPETLQSRLPARNGTELTTMLSKILWYEQTPQTTNTAYYKTALMAAANYYQSQITVKEQTAERLITNLDYSTIHTMYSWNSSSISNVKNWITNGISILNYRGEGWYSGWYPDGYNFFYDDVESINNINLLPVITSIGCGVGMFDGSTASFSHTWMTMGSATEHKGAVAFMGPTFNTRTIINNWLDRGIYRGFCYHDITRSAAVFNYGKIYAYNYLYDYNDPVYGVAGIREHLDVHMREYVLQGTPDLWWRTDIPRNADIYTAWSPDSDRDGIVVIDDTGNRVANAQLSFLKDNVRRLYTTNSSGGCRVFMRDVDEPIPCTLTGWNLFPSFTTYLPQMPGEDGDIIITEIKPDIETTGIAGDKVELYNNGTTAVDLAGWTIGDLDGYDIPFTMSAAVLDAGDIAVVEFLGFDGLESVTQTGYGLLIRSRAQPGLSSEEDQVVLRNTLGTLRDAICYHNGTTIGSTDAAYDLSKLTPPGSELGVGTGGWWTGPDTVTNELYESLTVNWSAFKGNGGPGSIQRIAIPEQGQYDNLSNFIAVSTDNFGVFSVQKNHVTYSLSHAR